MTIRTRWICVAAILGACAGYAVLAAAPAPAASLPPVDAQLPPANVLRFSPPRLDFGEIPVGEARTAEVRLENPGPGPLRLLNVLPNCSCLKVEVPDRTIPPGGGGSLRITYSAAAAGQAQRLLVQVFLDHPACPRADILVTGRARQEIAVEPRVLQFGLLAKGATRTMEAVVRHVEGRDFDLKPLRIGQPQFESSLEPLEPGRRNAYRLRVTARAARPGWVTEAVSLMTDDSGAVRALLYLNLGVEREVALEPSFAAAPAGAPLIFALRRTTPGELAVTRVRESRGLPVDFDVEREGPSRLRLRVRLAGASSFGQILIETDVEPDPIPAAYRIDRGSP